MKTINIVLLDSHGSEFDRVEVRVKDVDDCAREVLAAMTCENWVLSVGDRIEVQTSVDGTRGIINAATVLG